jgi:hypothetical protein
MVGDGRIDEFGGDFDAYIVLWLKAVLELCGKFVVDLFDEQVVFWSRVLRDLV